MKCNRTLSLQEKSGAGGSPHGMNAPGVASPSPLNGERAGVRGGNGLVLAKFQDSSGITTPHPQSLSPLRGEGGRANSQRGVALILTLIMLAIITIVTVVFLATASRNRQSTTVRIDQTASEFATETAAQHAQGKIIERVMRETNLLAFDFFVSRPIGYGLQIDNGLWVPVNDDVIPRVHNASNTVNVFLNLNRNPFFDDPGDGTNRPFGDPIWLGILDRPWFPHSRTNRFVARYAYLVQPIGKSLDLNTIHNDTSPNAGYGYMRNQGFGPWELNLGAFFHELDPFVWDYDYDYRRTPGRPEARGRALADARSIVNYRHGWPTTPIPFDARSFSQVYPDALFRNFPLGEFDVYADGNNGYLLGQNISLFDDDTPLKALRWPGADTTNHFFHIQELFDKADVRSNKVTVDFYSNLTSYITRQLAPGETNGSGYYKLLAQLGTQTGSDVNEKINLNWADFHAGLGYSPTNFVGWDSSPALALAFFTNVAERIFLAQSNEFNPSTNLLIRSILEIPVYPTNRYSSGIHRILQLAANIFDAANTNLYPSVFRPLFGPGPIPGVNYIVGYTNDNRTNTLQTWLNSNTNGIPLVVGAKKGFPNFNEFFMQAEFLVARKVEVTRSATNLPPDGTNMMYTLSLSNRFGVELWNSYKKEYPRGVTITISNFTVATLTNEFGYILQTNSPSLSMTNIPAGRWPGRDNALSFVVPILTTNTFLPNSMYRFVTPPNTFVPISANDYERNLGFPVPHWYLTLSNRMTCLISEGNRIVDFVLLNDDLTVNLSRELLSGQEPYPSGTPNTIVGVWNTNRTAANGPTDGILQQINISAGDTYYQLPAQYWTAYSSSGVKNENDKLLAISNFRDFLKLPPNPGDPTPRPNSSLKMQAPFNPAAKLIVLSVWQVNDPLVHYHPGDLRYEPPTNHFFLPSQPATNIAPATMGSMNVRYSPWLGRPASGTYPEPSDLRIKDSGVVTSDDWHFPSNKLATIGLLGRVHRGTPWQTVYVKSFEVPPGQSDPWYPESKDTASITVNNVTRTISRTHPTNDWKLLDMFTTSLDERTSTGLVSINQTNMETWSALLSGVLVLSNNLAGPQLNDTRTYEELLIEPSGGVTNGFYQIWTNIHRYQLTKGLPRPGGVPLPLQGVGELIQKVPELTTQSPFLHLDPQASGNPQLTHGLDDFAYEQIPQQILSLLRIGDSRFVIYAYGQALKPQHIDPATGVVDNYQVSAEFATRTVLRLEGDPRGRVRAVVESYNILPPD